MKKSKIVLISLGVLVIFGLAASSYYRTQQAKQGTKPEPSSIQQPNVGNSTITLPTDTPATYTLATVTISGFDCPSCPLVAETAIKNSAGVLDAKMTESGEGSRILYDSTITNLDKIGQVLPETYKINLVKEEPSTAATLN